MSGEDDGDESRSERLRRRRSQRADQSSGSSETSESGQQTGVKAEREGVYMYLTQQQKKEVERLYNVLKAEYEFEFDDDLEKNRHFYPLLVQHGLDGLDGLDAQDLREHLESI